MNGERPMSVHLERALVDVLFAISEFDLMRAQTTARGEAFAYDTLGALLLLLRSALDSAVMLADEVARSSALRPEGPVEEPVKP